MLVVGAGPAGVAAAITAHERGLRTRLVDKAAFPRDKTCGDGLTAQALRLLERFGVDVPALADFATVRETVLVSPGGRQVTLPLPEDGISSAVVPRLELDAALVDRARALGVDVRVDAPVTALLEDAGTGMLRARAGDDEIVARHLIAADGHWSAVRRLREPDAAADLGTWHAVRQYFRGVKTPSQTRTVGPRDSGCCSRPTSSPATRGSSRSRAAGRTSASACSASRTSRGSG